MNNKSYRTSSIWGAIEIASMLITAPLARLWFNRWGASAEERTRTLPGDDLIPSPKLSYTHAITIHAPATAIWPWLIQMGQGRGGLYSYDGLENLVGCQIHSADNLIPEHQNLKEGDHILFGPAEKHFPGQVVREIQPEHAIVMVGLDPVTRQAAPNATWVFYLDQRSNGTTRLLVRGLNAYEPGLANHVIWHIVEPIAFVMERRMLKGIKARVENSLT